MIALQRLRMNDLTDQHSFEIPLQEGGDLTPSHTVWHAVEWFRQRLPATDAGVRWVAVSRGVLLDPKQRLSHLPAADEEWTVMPEVAAG